MIDGDEPVAEQTCKRSLILCAVGICIDADRVTLGRHRNSNTGDRIERDLDVLAITSLFDATRLLPADHEIIAVFAADAG